MKNQSTQTRIRASKDMDTVMADQGTPIRAKSSIAMPRGNETYPKRLHNQLAGKHTVYAPTLNSTQGPKVVCVYAGRKELAK